MQDMYNEMHLQQNFVLGLMAKLVLSSLAFLMFLGGGLILFCIEVPFCFMLMILLPCPFFLAHNLPRLTNLHSQ